MNLPEFYDPPAIESELPLTPEEQALGEYLALIVRGMADYRYAGHAYQQFTVQATQEGWYVRFHSNDVFTSVTMAGCQPDLFHALRQMDREEHADNPLDR